MNNKDYFLSTFFTTKNRAELEEQFDSLRKASIAEDIEIRLEYHLVGEEIEGMATFINGEMQNEIYNF
jgi:hypothetical protein